MNNANQQFIGSDKDKSDDEDDDVIVDVLSSSDTVSMSDNNENQDPSACDNSEEEYNPRVQLGSMISLSGGQILTPLQA